jgi:polysaccharide export outer membrane protein
MLRVSHRIEFICFSLVAGVFCLQLPVAALAQSPGSMSARGFAVQPAAPLETSPQSPVVTVSKPAVQSSQNGQSQANGNGGFVSSLGGQGQQGIQGQGLSPSLGAVNGDYLLRPGDSIEMIVYREQDLNIKSKIGRDGLVQLPLLGEVKIGGLTVRAATALIRGKYNADYLVEPQIYLNVVAYNTTKFTMIGQVNKPGTYEYSASDPLGLLEAIGMAGGFTRIADRGHVVVKRREGDKVRTIKVNAKRLTDSGVDQFLIQSGDVINIGESWY